MNIYSRKADLIEATIRPSDTVLDVGFWGQGIDINNPAWIHTTLKKQAAKVYGLDIYFDENKFTAPFYIKASAENFVLSEKVDVVFAGDLIEHLSNPGLFLDQVRQNLKPGGRLIISTPNAFNLFNLVEKLTKNEPTVNREHTCYFNRKTLGALLERHGFEVIDVSFVYLLDVKYKPSWKKKVLDGVYWFLSKFTSKFTETLVIVAQPKVNI